MSGILDKKSRIIDYKLTENGRKQIQNGDINFKYYAFSDSSIVYNEKTNTELDFKISGSEFNYIPFEVSTDPYYYINPEFNLTDEIDLNDNTSLIAVNDINYTKFIDLNAINTTSDQIISKKYLNTVDILNESKSFDFKFKKVSNLFDFNESLSTNLPLIKYPTIHSLEKDLYELKNIDK